MIKNYNNVNTKKINICYNEIEKLNKNFYFIPIVYKKNELIIQTPKLYIPFNVTNFKNKSFITFKINIFKNELFCKFLNKLNKIIKKKASIISKKINNKIKKFKSPFKVFENDFNISLTLHINNNTQIFNNKNIKINKIKPQNYSKLIIYISNIWIKNDMVGIKFKLLQLKIYNKISYIEKCLILDSDEEEENSHICKICSKKLKVNIKNIKEDKKKDKKEDNFLKDLDDKYKKMYKLGIPKQAILQKIQLDKCFNIRNKLKKTVRNKNTRNSKNKSNNNIITLNDILTAKKKLKKTGFKLL